MQFEKYFLIKVLLKAFKLNKNHYKTQHHNGTFYNTLKQTKKYFLNNSIEQI